MRAPTSCFIKSLIPCSVCSRVKSRAPRFFQTYERASVHRNGPTVTVHHPKCREKRQSLLTSLGVPPGDRFILLHRIIGHRYGTPCVFVRGPRTRYALSAAAFSSSFSLYTESPITPPSRFGESRSLSASQSLRISNPRRQAEPALRPSQRPTESVQSQPVSP